MTFRFTEECPDNNDHPRVELQERHRDRIVLLSGFEANYFRVALLRSCVARSAAIDLAEGIGLLGPEPDSHCTYDHEEWDGGGTHP